MSNSPNLYALYSCLSINRVGMTDVGWMMDASQQATMTSVEVAFSLDDELDSPTEESERKARALADDFNAEFDAIVAAQESGALPPPPSPPTPQAAAVDFAVCRATLSEFFLKRSDTTKKGEATYWSLYETLPGKGKDTEFDKLVINLGLVDNRSYVASRWLEHRKAQGVYPPPVIEMNDNLHLKDNVSKLVSSEVIEKAMAETEKHFAKNVPGDYRACSARVKNAAAIQAYLQSEVDKFCKKLCGDVLSGAKPNNYQKRASDFKILGPYPYCTLMITSVYITCRGIHQEQVFQLRFKFYVAFQRLNVLLRRVYC